MPRLTIMEVIAAGRPGHEYQNMNTGKISIPGLVTPTADDSARRTARASQPMFRMLRYFSIASLLCILATAATLVIVYRNVVVESLQEFGKERNAALARTALIPIHEEVVGYLTKAGDVQPGQAPMADLPVNLRNTIRDLMAADGTVARVKLYNRLGTVVFSTKGEQIGSRQEDNDGFRSAIQGIIFTEFLYRDALNPFDQTTEEDNLIQTYVPVRTGGGGPVVGVFEIYTDMNPLVRQVERVELTVTAASLGVLLLLYGVLVLIVRRAKRMIDVQQHMIRERTDVLEMLSSQMIKNEEKEKQRLATELHEGIAQTLSAVKLNVEYACRLASNLSPQSALHLEAVIPSLQNAIQEVRGISMALRPSSLDDLGILATLAWLCREVEAIYPDIRIHQQFEVHESQVPAHLKVIIYRIAEAALNRIARRAESAMVRIRLLQRNDGVEFLIEDQAVHLSEGERPEEQNIEPDLALMFLMERATLSGGSLSCYPNEWGGTTLHSRWPV